MKTFYFKTFCATLICLCTVLFYQRSRAAALSAVSGVSPFLQHDTARFQAPKRFKRHVKVKANEEKEQEDGIDDDIRARAVQEFYQKRDLKTNRVPTERLLAARAKRDMFLQTIKKRPKAPANLPKTPGAAPVAPPSIAGLLWNERGPNNVGGRTRALMFDMNDAANGYKKVFAGGVDGGLWVTNDITATTVQWTKINDFMDNLAISCIAQSPVNPQIIYAGTGEGFLNVDAVQGLGVWKSTDGGATWTHLAGTEPFKYINAILVDKNGSVYIAGETDIFVGFGVDKSSDGGSTWTNVISSSEAGADLQMAANGDVYASTGVYYVSGHIYVSDFGVNGANTGNAGTWTNITPSSAGVITPSTTSWDRIKLALAPSNSNIVYAFMETHQSTALGSTQVYNRSTNTWTVKAKPTEAFSNGQSWYSIAAAVDPNNPNVLWAGSLDAELSTDGGATWTQYTHWNYPTNNSAYVHADHHAYVYQPGSSTSLIMGCDGGVFITANATTTPPTFNNRNNGYNVTQFYSVAMHPTNYNYFLAGAQDNGSEKFTSAGVGPSSVATGGDGADVFIDQTNGNIQITSYVRDQYYLSTDNGNTFNGLGSYGNGQFINPTDYDPSTKTIYAGSASGDYYRATAITTSPGYNEVFVSGFSGANVNSVTVAPITANRVYFGLDNGNVVRVDNAQTGSSLTGTVLSPNGGAGGMVSCVTVDPSTEDHILVSYSNYGIPHIYETKNASSATPTWTDVSGNLPDMPVRSMLFYPGDATKAIIATELGVWTTDLINGGSTTWDPNNGGLANVEVDMLKYRAADQTIAAATHGRGLFTASLVSPNLSALTTSTGTLTPAFSASTLSYTESVANSVSSITVTPTAASPSATINVNGTAVTSGSASGAIALNVGANTISIVVTANSNTQTYTLTVTRAASPVATLSNLVVNGATISPAFASNTINYTSTVLYNVPSVTVTPTATNVHATIKVNGVATPTGTTSGSIALNVGDNVITTVVTAPDKVTTKTYTVTITRLQSANASLTTLGSSIAPLTPAFTPNTTSYAVSVPNTTTSMTVKPVTSDPNATMKVNGTTLASGTTSAPIALAVGSNTINVVVTAPNGTTVKTYTITATRAPSANAALSAINPQYGPLSPVFNTNTTSYTESVANSKTTFTVAPVTSDATATMKVNGTTLASGSTSTPIALAEGAVTAINIVVTAQDGVTTKTYTINVTRAASSVSTLAGLSLSAGAITPTFATATINYTLSVDNSVAGTTVTPTATDVNAVIKVNGTTVASGATSGAIALAEGAVTNVFVVLTSQDGTTTKTYKVAVTRAPSSNATLASMNPSVGPMSPAFYFNTTSYTLKVPNSKTSVTVAPVTTDANATIKVNGTTLASGATSAPVLLAEGVTTNVTVAVTAQDGTTTKTYTIAVTRAPSNDASLSAINPQYGPLSPVFNTNTTSYTESVANSKATMTVAPVTTDANATMTVNGTALASGTTSAPVALTAGATTNITIVITAQDGTTTKTYTIAVTRAAGGADAFEPISVSQPANSALLNGTEINVHQGVTPNGDGVEDFLQIDNINQYPDNRLSIMNRNGQLVFEAKGYDNASKVFDGRSNKNGQMQVPGTYFYQLDYTVDGIVKHKTGFIILKY